ncbi:MAG: VanZ family protein [Sphingomonadales bacterium]|nr:VanZ family protein [Sphingomonadales bacterium]NCO47824.1 VanZ family protein [Sphingomonadales bacterium]NCP01336.1 VanZ family protein [Sphingomonadales bacterium]NCP27471.1 VanZ family protein [Sphingomonadales bacterium]NCP42146.1 VanZ family protein [Sphingomonadales bacterium]
MNAQTISRILFWLLLGTILVISLMPATDAPTVFADDKLNHILAFFTLSLMARLLWTRTHAAILFVLLMALGGGIELLQLSMGFGRDADWWDFVADIVAILLGMLAGKLFWSMKRKRSATE